MESIITILDKWNIDDYAIAGVIGAVIAYLLNAAISFFRSKRKKYCISKRLVSSSSYQQTDEDGLTIKVLYKDRVAAVASLAIEDGYSLLHNVIVDPALRGKGLGKKLCYAAISKSKAEEADYSYLQVIETNEVALNLYKKFGYEKLYTYWYMVRK